MRLLDRSSLGAELEACARFLRDQFEDPSIGVERFVAIRGNDALIHALYRQIGSAGLLYERATQRIFEIPSAVGADVYIWAHERGARFEQDNLVVIDEVRDPAVVARVLKLGIEAPFVNDDIVPRLGAPLGLTLSFQTLWQMLRGLHDADRADAPFLFRFNPRTAIPAARWPEEA